KTYRPRDKQKPAFERFRFTQLFTAGINSNEYFLKRVLRQCAVAHVIKAITKDPLTVQRINVPETGHISAFECFDKVKFAFRWGLWSWWHRWSVYASPSKTLL